MIKITQKIFVIRLKIIINYPLYTLMNKNSSDLDLFLMSHCKNFL